MRTAILCLALAMGFALPNQASAASCGTVYGTTGHDTIVLGPEVVYYSQIGWVQTGNLFACIDNGITQNASDSGCSGFEHPLHWVTVNAWGGNDIVAPHAGGVINCNGVYIGPWPTYGANEYTVSLEINGGPGGDTIYGSPGPDRLHSNNFSGTDDGADDMICGYGGADAIHGDLDDTSDLECMNGGDGAPLYGNDADSCAGMGEDGAYEPDLHYECETRTSAAVSWDLNGPWCRDDCGDYPPVVM